MIQTNISTLKSQLSRFLDQVRAGQEVVISDRNRAVAVLVPFMAGFADDWSSRVAELARRGQIAPPRHTNWREILPLQQAKPKKAALLSEAVIEERRSAR